MGNSWKERRLGDFMNFKNGLNADKDDYGSGLKFVNVMDIFANNVLRKAAIRGSVFASAKSAHDYSVEYGDVLFNRTSETPEDIACASVYLDSEPITFGGFVLRGRQRKQVLDPNFSAYAFQAEDVRRELIRRGQGAVRANIGQQDLAKVPILVPPLPEQHRIAEILRTWDEAIEATQTIIRLREFQYKGLREHLIDWFSSDRVALRKLVRSTTRQVPRPNEPYRALGIRSHGKGTFERFVSDPASVAMEHLYVAKAGDLIVNITFAWEGAVALVPSSHDGGLVSHRFPTFEPCKDKVSPRFLRHALRMPRFTYLLGVVSPGGAGRNRVLNKSDFLELEIPAPSLKDQNRVARILNDAEEVIVIERQSLEALQRQKRGLMQKLLTGEWRVKVGQPASGGS